MVDYHNKLLNLLKNEANSNDDENVIGPLKDLINDLTSKEISILQIVRDNTGIITLNDNDCLSIEQLSRATVNNQNEQINYDFIYIQSFIIRTYLLLCPINYQHIIQNYQCYIRRTQINNDTDILDLDKKYSIKLTQQQIEIDWNYLKQIYFDKLYHSYNLIKQIIILIKNSQEDLSEIMFYQFILSLENNIEQQIKDYQIKDFKLCFIDHIKILYFNSIKDFQYLFIDISQTLRIPIEINLDEQINQMFQGAIISIDYQDNIEKIQLTIKIITNLLNDLRSIENHLLREWSESLKYICSILHIENSILDFIPDEIKCENYVAISIHLIRMRTILQERIVNIEVKQTKQWNENIDNNYSEQKLTNRFLDYLNDSLLANKTSEDLIESDDKDLWPEIPNYIPIDVIEDNLLDKNDSLEKHQFPTTEETFEYLSLFELNIKYVSLKTSNLFEQIHEQFQQLELEIININKAQKFMIYYPNGELKTRLWKSENLFEKLRNLFDMEKFDFNQYVIIDNNEILIDFTNNNTRLSKKISLEYFIIDKSLLISIQFHFRTKLYEYFATSKTNIYTIINHFINDNNIKLSSTDIYLCFFDQYGKAIENGILSQLINQIDENSNKIISITVTEENNNNNMLCQVTLQSKQGKILIELFFFVFYNIYIYLGEQQISLFHPSTQWEEINYWLQNFNQIIDSSINEYSFFDKQQKIIIEENRPIYLILEDNQTAIIDGISRDLTIKVIFSYENNSTLISALKSMRICHLLNNERLLRELNLIDISPNDCVLLLGENNQKILSQDDIQQSIGNYSYNDNQIIYFRISISIQILKYDNQQESLQILLSNRNTTIENIFQLTNASRNIYKYLASNYTKKILNYDEKLSNLIDTKFILVKEHETCLISIEKSKNNQLIDIEDEQNIIHQRFTIFATIEHICRENQIDIDHQYLIYSNDFVPSIETQLIYFKSESPSIRFTLTDNNLPVAVTVLNNQDKRLIKFHCSLTITVKRLCSIACQLFGVNNEYYRLKENDCLLDDDDVTLYDINSAMTDIQFELISIALINSSIKYNDQIILIPCCYKTSAETIIIETLTKLNISIENRYLYELFALADDRTPIESDLSIEDVYQLFSSSTTTIPFELIKKDE